jgi:hypothetical protein
MKEALSQMILRAESVSATTGEEIESHCTLALDHALALIKRARELEDASTYGDLENKLDELRSDLRESIQGITRGEMWRLIRKLRGKGPITDEELALIRLWVVGDADAYVQEEHNFGEWIEELDRLTVEIRNLRIGPVEVDRLEQLRALLMSAREVTRSIAVFLNDRERVEHFEKSTHKDLTKGARQTLANILVRLYQSPEI